MRGAGGEKRGEGGRGKPVTPPPRLREGKRNFCHAFRRQGECLSV